MTQQAFRRALSIAAFINEHEGCDAVLTGSLELRVSSEVIVSRETSRIETEVIPATLTAALTWLGY